MNAREHPFLILDWQGTRAALDAARERLVLGSGAAAQLRVAGRYVSRLHGHIERRSDGYFLVDRSTNGTFIQTEDERVAYLHRGEMRLWGQGWIALGEPVSEGSAVRFRLD